MNKRLLLYNIEQRKVGCVLMQATLGGDSDLCRYWNDWEIDSTEGMKLYPITVEQAKKLAEADNKIHSS